MDWTLEVVVVSVGDVDRAIAFYRDGLGFNLDHDTRAGDQRFAQLTPPGSRCSIVLSDPPPMPPGSLKGVQLVVADAHRAREQNSNAASPRGISTSSTSATGARCSDSPTPTATLPRKQEVPPGSYNRSRRGRTELNKTDDPGRWGTSQDRRGYGG